MWEQRWFAKEALQVEVDRQIAREFGGDLARAAANEFDGVAAADRSGMAALALIVLLDQFTRNVHRGTPDAFAYDAHARVASSDRRARGVPARPLWALRVRPR